MIEKMTLKTNPTYLEKKIYGLDMYRIATQFMKDMAELYKDHRRGNDNDDKDIEDDFD